MIHRPIRSGLGRPSNATQSNLERQEIEELKKQNSIIKYLTEIQRESERTRERPKGHHIEIDRATE
ncbi:hypothetical protein [Staphylococcus aureus]